VPHVDLLDSVWDDPREGSAIRGVAKRLRHRLAAAGMADVADAIDGSVSGFYGLILVCHPGNSWQASTVTFPTPTERRT
jgi:hypothetical protein